MSARRLSNTAVQNLINIKIRENLREYLLHVKMVFGLRVRSIRAGVAARLQIVYRFDQQALLVRCHLVRSDEHTSELQSLMRNSYAVFCLNKKNNSHMYTQT